MSVRLCKDCNLPGKKGNPLSKDGLHLDWVECMKTIKAKCAALEEHNDRMFDALNQINQWAQAYPLDVFPEPDFAKVREALEAANLSLDQVSASNMRHVITQVKSMIYQTEDKRT